MTNDFNKCDRIYYYCSIEINKNKKNLSYIVLLMFISTNWNTVLSKQIPCCISYKLRENIKLYILKRVLNTLAAFLLYISLILEKFAKVKYN